MKAKQYSTTSKPTPVVLLFILLFGLASVNAQCPTVVDNNQSFCDLESILVSDLVASDSGNGIVWYDSATSTIPLSNLVSLIDGEDYYADDNSGTCGARARVEVTIYSSPTGQNFQGVCSDDPTFATVADLVAVGNDVQWYLTASGGLPLDSTTVLIDNTIYYADQVNPDTGCRTSRLSVLVNVGLTPAPTGEIVQEFCFSSQFTPTVADLVASGTNNWYISLFSASPLPDTTPLVNGQIYYATTIDPPCESTGRFAVLAILTSEPDPGTNGVLDLCDTDTNTVDLFTVLGGSPEPGGEWSPALTIGNGIFDPTMDLPGLYTYTISSINTCPDVSSSVTVNIFPQPNAGTNSEINLCRNDSPINLFDSLGGNPDVGGTWSPMLPNSDGFFDPSVDTPGIYTYTVTSNECNLSDDASVTVIIGDIPDISGMILSIDDIICFADDIIVNIDGASQLVDGNYDVVYELSGTNMSTNSITISVTSGSSSFTIPQNLFPNTGLTILTISEFYFAGEFCNADTSTVNTIEIVIPNIPTPQISADGGEFCEFDDTTVANLTENIISSGTILWYNQPNDGIAYSETDMLQDGVTYYATLQSESGCESIIRLAVTVNISDCVLVELIIPDGFSPNDDTINDDFHIVNLNELYPNFKLSIYNRYGNVLYEGDINSNRWDGTSKKNNKILPVGVYFYILEFNDDARSPLQGRVYLSR